MAPLTFQWTVRAGESIPYRKQIIPSKVTFFGMISTLPLELWIGTSMMPSEIIIVVHYKVSELSKSVVKLILIVKLST